MTGCSTSIFEQEELQVFAVCPETLTLACAESDCLTPSTMNGSTLVVIISICSGLCRDEMMDGLKSGRQLPESSSLS